MAAKKNPTYQEVGKDISQELAILNSTLSGRLDAIDSKIQHQSELIDERMKPIADHEKRIRNMEEAIITLKTKYDWLTGGSFAASIGALIKAILGG